MFDSEKLPENRLEYMAILPDGVDFNTGMKNLCETFHLEMEEEDDGYWAASGELFSLRAKTVKVNSVSDSRTLFLELTAEDAFFLQNAREEFDEKGITVVSKIVLLRDSVGEKRTIEAYRLLNELENTLRKLVIVRTASLSSENWWEERVAKCLRQSKGKYEYAERMDREVNDTDITPQKRNDHHDIFYLDLLDLKKTIEDPDNWEKGFEGDLRVQRNIERLEVFNRLRRKIAHNRFLSQRNLDDLREIHGHIMSLCRRVFEM